MLLQKKITAGVFVICAVMCAGKFFSCRSKGLSREAVSAAAMRQILLGRYLFYDRRLSINNTRACATCHNPAFAFTDGYKRAPGAFADLQQRNTQGLFNLSALKYLTAADSGIHTPEQQMTNPLLNDHPVEMGVKENENNILQKIKADERYQKLFNDIGQSISWGHIKEAISSFILTLRSENSPYDNFLKGDSNALSLQAKKGAALFFSTALNCSSCHGGNNFSTPNITDAKGDTVFYFNTGIYNIDSSGAYPDYDQGLFMLTKNKKDMGKFRVPSLRNLAFTSPYFHDGSAASLGDVTDSYAAGGRNIIIGDDKGNGALNPYKHALIKGFTISPSDKINLISFLLSLSDSSFIKNPAYQNPFSEDETEKKY